MDKTLREVIQVGHGAFAADVIVENNVADIKLTYADVVVQKVWELNENQAHSLLVVMNSIREELDRHMGETRAVGILERDETYEAE